MAKRCKFTKVGDFIRVSGGKGADRYGYGGFTISESRSKRGAWRIQGTRDVGFTRLVRYQEYAPTLAAAKRKASRMLGCSMSTRKR